jgi:hypothetical protein
MKILPLLSLILIIGCASSQSVPPYISLTSTNTIKSLIWTYSDMADITSFNLYQYPANSTNWQFVASIPAPSTNYTFPSNTVIGLGTAFTLTASNSNWSSESDGSNQITNNVPPILAPPASLISK